MLFTIYTTEERENRENRYYTEVGLMCYIGAEYKMRNLLSDPGTVIEMLHAVNILPLAWVNRSWCQNYCDKLSVLSNVA